MANKDISIKDWLTKQTNKLVENWEQAIEKLTHFICEKP